MKKNFVFLMLFFVSLNCLAQNDTAVKDKSKPWLTTIGIFGLNDNIRDVNYYNFGLLYQFKNNIYFGSEIGFVGPAYGQSNKLDTVSILTYLGFNIGYKNKFNDNFGYFLQTTLAFALIDEVGYGTVGTCFCGFSRQSLGIYRNVFGSSEIALNLSVFQVYDENILSPGLSYNYRW